jgi:citrate synthase
VSEPFLTSAEAASLLGVSRASLYAYVSRGLLQSVAAEPGSRHRLYRRDEVLRLVESRRRSRSGRSAAEGALSWGSPVLESALTLIGDGKLYYRGVDVATLARSYHFEEVARLLWTGRTDGELFARTTIPRLPLRATLRRRLVRLPPVTRMQVVLPLAADADLSAYDLRPEAIHPCGVRILALCTRVAVLAGDDELRRTESAPAASPPLLAHELQRAWCPRIADADRALDAVLVLCADHELNVSSFAARVIASARATPYDVVLGGLAALRGTRHGASALRAERLLRELWDGEQVGTAALRRQLGQRLRLGERLPGFSHPLYPAGDPRYRLVAARLGEVLPESPVLAYAERLVTVMDELVGEPPNLDLALGIAALALGLPEGSSLTLFAIGRIAGWIAHAAEQTQRSGLIRPRARYVGPGPESAP